jgi:hypothetical protein
MASFDPTRLESRRGTTAPGRNQRLQAKPASSRFPSVHEADVERQQRAICAIRLAAGKIALNRDRLRRAGKQIFSLAGGMAGQTLSDMGDNAVAAATPRRIRTSV